MTLRSTLTALLLVGLSPHLGAQTVTIEAEPKTTLLDGKTMIKAHPLGIIFGDYTLSGERVLTPGLSVGLEVSARFASPNRAYGGDGDNYRSGGLLWGTLADRSYFALTPELRWYTNGGLGHGFYFTLYYRFLSMKQNHLREYMSVPRQGNAPLEGDLTYRERLSAHSVGVGIGAQWLLGSKKNIVLDWHIIGVSNDRGIGSVEGTYQFRDKLPHQSDIDENVLKDLLIDRTQAHSDGIKATIDRGAQTFSITKVRSMFISPRMSLSIGFRF